MTLVFRTILIFTLFFFSFGNISYASNLEKTQDPFTQDSIHLLSWNIQNLYIPGDFSKMGLSLENRSKKLVTFLQNHSEKWQVVLLQEVWTQQGLKRLSALENHYPYQFDSDSKKIDARFTFKNFCKFVAIQFLLRNNLEVKPLLDRGLTILSRLPILNKATLTFSENGDHRFTHLDGESLARKGAIGVLLFDPSQDQKFWVINTHLVANYKKGNSRKHDYAKQRLKQIAELSDWIEKINPQGFPVILGGDLNVGPNHDSTPSVWQEIPKYLMSFMVPQGETILNTHKYGQLDHLLATQNLKMTNSKIVPGRKMKISDHDGISASFRLTNKKTSI